MCPGQLCILVLYEMPLTMSGSCLESAPLLVLGLTETKRYNNKLHRISHQLSFHDYLQITYLLTYYMYIRILNHLRSLQSDWLSGE